MTQEPKLLTRAQLDQFGVSPPLENLLRERGLIAPEPVDPLVEIAKEIRNEWLRGEFQGVGDAALAAIKRAMELRPKLTRDMVREALLTSAGTGERYYSNVHAALTEMMKGDVE